MNHLNSTEDQPVVGPAELARQLTQLSQSLQKSIAESPEISTECFSLCSQISQTVKKLQDYFENTFSRRVSRSDKKARGRSSMQSMKKLDIVNDILLQRLRKQYKDQRSSIYDSKLHMTGILQQLSTETRPDAPDFWKKLEHNFTEKQIGESENEISAQQQKKNIVERLLADAEEINKKQHLWDFPSGGPTLPLPSRDEDPNIYTIHANDAGYNADKKNCVIHPKMTAKVFFDIFTGLLVLFSVVTIPIDLAFDAFVGNRFQIVAWIIDSIFLVDIALTFFTARLEGSDLIHSKRVIAKKYITSMFLPDLLSSIPYDVLVGPALSSAGNASVRMVRLLRLVRILRLLKFSRLLKLRSKFQTVDVSSALNVDPALATLCFRLFSILFFAHMMSCLWYSINSCNHEQDDWVRCGYAGDISSEYLASLYFIIQTMMTVGYGDIAVNTDAQRAFVICVQISGTLCVGIIVSSIEEVMDSFDSHSRYLSKRLQSVTQYMVGKKLPHSLMTKLKAHFTYFYNNTSVFPEQNIVNTLPHHVLEKLIISKNRNNLQKLFFFNRCVESGNTQFVIAVLPLLKPMLAQTGEIILRQGDPPEDLYFLKHGEVHGLVLDESGATVLMGIFRQGSTLNLANVMCFREMHCMLRSACRCDIVWLHLEDLEMVMDMFPAVSPLVTEMALAEIKKTTKVLECKSIMHGDFLVTEKVLCEPSKKSDEEVLEFSKVRMKLDIGLSSSRATQEKIRVLEHVKLRNQFENAEQKLQMPPKLFEQYRLKEGTTNFLKLKQKWLIFPHCPQKHYWDFFILILTMYSLICIPVSVGFSIRNDGLYAFDLLVDCCYLIDIVVTFRTLYELSPGLFVAEPWLLALHYLKKWFLIDLVSSFPTSALPILVKKHSAISTRLVRIARFFRYFKLMRIFKISWLVKMLGFENRFGASGYFLKQLILLAILLFYVGHFFGCFWAFIALQEGVDTSWMVYVPVANGDVAGSDLMNQYTAAVYWAFTTITTVGYGDIKPTTETERGYAVVVMLVGAALFSFIVGNVSYLAGLLTLQKQMNKTQAKEVNEFVKEQHLEFELANSVKKHFLFAFLTKSANQESGIVRRLPSSLRRELLWHSSQNIRNKLPFFCSSSDSFISLVVPRLTPQFNEAGTEIYNRTDGSKGLYIILQGIVEEIKHCSLSAENDQEELLCCIGTGAIFGYRKFLHMIDADVSARASDLYDCRMYVLYVTDIECLDKKFQQVGKILRDKIVKYVEIQGDKETTITQSSKVPT